MSAPLLQGTCTVVAIRRPTMANAEEYRRTARLTQDQRDQAHSFRGAAYNSDLADALRRAQYQSAQQHQAFMDEQQAARTARQQQDAANARQHQPFFHETTSRPGGLFGGIFGAGSLFT